jgi:acetyl esterase/lipase
MTQPVTAAAILLLLVTATNASAQTAIGKQIADGASISDSVQSVGADSFSGLKVAFPGGVIGYPDLTYQTLAGYRPLTLDLFLPPARFAHAGPRPLIVYVHGGGWIAGNPRRSAAYRDWPKVLASIAAKGYVVASVSYRFSREEPFPAAIQDVKAAVRWLHANGATYQIDPKRTAIWGQSSGGHLSVLAGLSCNVAALEPGARIVPATANVETVASTAAGSDEASDCVQAVVGWFGIYDFTTLKSLRGGATVPITGPRIENVFLDCPEDDCTVARRRFASPIAYVDRSDPPVLLIHGANDRTVDVSQTNELDAALRANGVSVTKVIIPGVDHSWIGKTPEATREASAYALRTTIDFIDAAIGDHRPK